MPKFERCVEAHEISLTRAGANQLAHALIRKNRKDPANPVETEMTEEQIAKAVADAAAKLVSEAIAKSLGMSDVAKAHYLTLDAAAQAVFMAKSVADQTTEAEAAKTAADKAKKDEVAKAKGQTAKEAELEKSLAAANARTEALEKRLNEREIEEDIKKRAEDPAFKGYPGGTEAVKSLIKSIKGLDEAAQAPILDLAKSQAQMARTTSTIIGLQPSEETLEKSAPSMVLVEKRVKEVMAEKSISHAAALNEVREDPEYRKHVAKAASEQRALQEAQ